MVSGEQNNVRTRPLTRKKNGRPAGDFHIQLPRVQISIKSDSGQEDQHSSDDSRGKQPDAHPVILRRHVAEHLETDGPAGREGAAQFTDINQEKDDERRHDNPRPVTPSPQDQKQSGKQQHHSGRALKQNQHSQGIESGITKSGQESQQEKQSEGRRKLNHRAYRTVLLPHRNRKIGGTLLQTVGVISTCPK